MGVDDWQLAQGTVDFRNEERRANGRSYVPRPPSCSQCAQNPAATRLGLSICVVCAGLVPAPDESPLPQGASCPNCLVELDEDGFCSLCGKVVKR